MVDDDANFDELDDSSSFEDALFEDDSDNTNNTESDHSGLVRQYWMDWQRPEFEQPISVPKPPKMIPKLFDMCAIVAGKSLSFDQLETHYQMILERQRRRADPYRLEEPTKGAIIDAVFVAIIKHCFPNDDNDIRLYSCLANGTAQPFKNGESIFKNQSVREVIQIGYHISAVVQADVHDDMRIQKLHAYSYYSTDHLTINEAEKVFHVTIRVDRGKIISTSCTCKQSAWCHHIVATCLYRIHYADKVEYRPTILDSVGMLNEEKLKKLVQYFIHALPRQFLPVAQRLIDELHDEGSEINRIKGAPDPTDGGHDDVPIWNVDIKSINSKIRAILVRFIKPSPIVHCDVHMLSAEPQPPVKNEFKIRRSVLMNRNPTALWNFFSIVREMLKREDENATILLHLITTNCLTVDQIVFFWYIAKLLESGKWHMQLSSTRTNRSLSPNSYIQMLYEASALFDEIVRLWKVAAVNPKYTLYEREKLVSQLQFYHRKAVSRIWVRLSKPDKQMKVMVNASGKPLSTETANFTPDFFPGFRIALEACQIDFNCPALRELPSSVIQLASTSKNYCDDELKCPHIPLLRREQKEFARELESCLTTTFLWDDPTQVTNASTRKHRSKKRRRRPHRALNAGQRQNVSVQNSGSASGNTFDYSGGEDSQHDEFPDRPSQLKKERYELELDGCFALTHADREPLQVRVDVCDSLMHHGFLTEAAYFALKVGSELLDSTPQILYEGMAYSNNVIECTPDPEEVPGARTKRSRRTMFSGVLLVRQIDSCPRKIEVQLPCPNALKATEHAVACYERAIAMIKVLLGCLPEDGVVEVNGKSVTTTDMLAMALEIGASALSISRFPAPTHQLEVYLFHLEYEILELLRQIRLRDDNLPFLRRFAVATIKKCKQVNTDKLPPTTLAMFLVDSMSATGSIGRTHNGFCRTANDEDLGMQVALTCLEMRLSYVEEDYPMMFECFRKQRRALAYDLILKHKDSPHHLGLVLDKLLDPTIHRMHDDHMSNGAYFLKRDIIYKSYSNGHQRPTFPAPAAAAVDGDEELQVADNVSEADKSTNSEDSKPAIPSLIDCMRNQMRVRESEVTPHATEALAQFYSGLAIKIHGDAGGSSATSQFTMNNNFINNVGVPRTHRNLYMCSFIIGLYAVGIHNLTYKQWVNRSQMGFHVGWLQQQALEIGRPALEFVRSICHKHLTPFEVATLADKACHRSDGEIQYQGALLAVTALRKADSLAPNDTINRLRQCREYNLKLTEDACVAIEAVATENPTYHQPQVLFQVAHYWYEIFQEESSMSNAQPFVGLAVPEEAPVAPLHAAGNFGMYHAHAVNNQPLAYNIYYNQQRGVFNANAQVGLHPSYSAPDLHPPAQLPYQYPPDANYGYYQNQPYKTSNYKYYSTGGNSHRSQRKRDTGVAGMPPCGGFSVTSPPAVPASDPRIKRLLNAYRVGMRALLSLRASEQGEQELLEKHHKEPHYNEDIMWLLTQVCYPLGVAYVQSFFEYAHVCVSSPSILFEIAKDSVNYFGTRHCLGLSVNSFNQVFIEQLPLRPLYNKNDGSNGSGPSSNLIQPISLVAMGLVSVPPTQGHFPYYNALRKAMVNEGFTECSIELVVRCIDMHYASFYHRVNMPRLNDNDTEMLKSLMARVRDLHAMIPGQGRNLLDQLAKNWKTVKIQKRKSYERVRAVIDNVLDALGPVQ